MFCKDMQEMKAELVTVKQASVAQQSKINWMEGKLNVMERHQRRWNLRLYGLTEREGEDVKHWVVNIYRTIIPDTKEDP